MQPSTDHICALTLKMAGTKVWDDEYLSSAAASTGRFSMLWFELYVDSSRHIRTLKLAESAVKQ